MPPKLAANMHVVQPKGLSKYLSIDNQLVSWGGTDTYEYVFEPEQLIEQPGAANALNESAPEADRVVSYTLYILDLLTTQWVSLLRRVLEISAVICLFIGVETGFVFANSGVMCIGVCFQLLVNACR